MKIDLVTRVDVADPAFLAAAQIGLLILHPHIGPCADCSTERHVV